MAQTVLVDNKITTLYEFTIHQLRLFPNATGELSALLNDIGLAAKRIQSVIKHAGLHNLSGSNNTINVQGERVQKLDIFANDQIVKVLSNGTSCAGIASEEMDDIVIFKDSVDHQSKYVVMFDPLDGSSNIDTSIPVGTIFGIYRRITNPGEPCDITDFLQAGIKQVAAGYIIYGSSTMMVYATRRGVNGFTLDPTLGEFCLTHPNIQCPVNGCTYSVNHSYFFDYCSGVQKMLKFYQKKKVNDLPFYSQRYVGSMVADIHRTLLKGGIFLYPANRQNPGGKLRLMYECNPVAFIMEAAGGQSIAEKERVLEINPFQLHQKTPFFAGSFDMIEKLKEFLCYQNNT